MSLFFAIIIGRFLRYIGKFVNRSSNLPGVYALKICPKFFKKLKISGKIIAVTGSNGKTTTANMIAHILRTAGYSVCNNHEGANLTSGVATTLLMNCTLSGELREDFIVLEVDERWARLIFKDVAADFIAVTNLVRDQVVRNGHPDFVFDKIQQAIAPETTLILNANDPISQNLGSADNKKILYALDKTSRSCDSSIFLTNDAKVCPLCFNKLDYDFYHYNHIGKFSCSNCNFSTDNVNFIGCDVDFENSSMSINNNSYSLTVKPTFNATYHFMNVVCAVATVSAAIGNFKLACKGVDSFIVAKERYEAFNVGDRKAYLVLTKQNSVSLDSSISYTLSQDNKKTVVLFVNNAFYTENQDVSWIYDVTLERLKDVNIDKIVCGGLRAYDVAVRLKLGGFNMEDVVIENDLSKLKDAIINQTQGDIYILAASAFGDDDGILKILK